MNQIRFWVSAPIAAIEMLSIEDETENARTIKLKFWNGISLIWSNYWNCLILVDFGWLAFCWQLFDVEQRFSRNPLNGTLWNWSRFVANQIEIINHIVFMHPAAFRSTIIATHKPHWFIIGANEFCAPNFSRMAAIVQNEREIRNDSPLNLMHSSYGVIYRYCYCIK